MGLYVSAYSNLKYILQDFYTYAELYAASGLESEIIGTMYANWTRAFELAANGGIVKFH